MKKHIFEINQQNLLLIYEVVQSFRQQSFFCWYVKAESIIKKYE